MKNFLTFGLGVVIGLVVGVCASFKAAENKYAKQAEEELAEERKNNIHRNCCEGCSCEKNEEIPESNNTSEETEQEIVEDDEEIPYDFKDSYEEIVEPYSPKKKPYIMEEQPIGFEEKHPFISEFTEVLVVYDKDKGRCADEDGCEIFNVQGLLGWNNLNKLYTDDSFARDNTMRIVSEQNGMIYRVHAGRLSEYMEDEEEEIGYDE
jgi:hypothetical protein